MVDYLEPGEGESFFPVIWKIVTTDVSLSVGGAVLGGDYSSGDLTLQERIQPINMLELRAVGLTLDSWTDQWHRLWSV